jgi:hypothetical protein
MKTKSKPQEHKPPRPAPARPLSPDELRQVRGGTRLYDPAVANAGNAAIDF